MGKNKSKPPVLPPKESVLKKYEPKVPPERCAISYTGTALAVTLREGQTVEIPETVEGLRVLRNILMAQRAARLAGSCPTLCSDSFPTQHQIDAWMKLKRESEEMISQERLDSVHRDILDDLEEVGF
jgi:hypothetical protein